MNKTLSKTIKIVEKTWVYAMCSTILWMDAAFAKLPTVDAAGQQYASNWLAVVKYYMKQGATIIALSLCMLSFIWVAYAALAKFNECRNGRAEWADLGVLVITGAAILIVLSLLLSTASGIIEIK